MRISAILCASLIALINSNALSTAAPIGVSTFGSPGGTSGRPISITVWYPALDGGLEAEVGANAVFAGVSAFRDAELAAGRFMTVIISHGGLRSAADSGAWLSARLAANGYVAVEVNAPPPRHPGEAQDEIWRRTEDISTALSLLEEEPRWAAHIDSRRVAVLGFQLGGTAALIVAGVPLDVSQYDHFCDADPARSECAWRAAAGDSLTSADYKRLGQLRRDQRISAAIAVNPEYVAAFTASNLADLAVPIGLIETGPQNTEAAALRAEATATWSLLDASPADTFGLCTKTGARILREEGGDPSLCSGKPQARQRVHGDIEAAVVDFLESLRPAAD